MINIDFKMFLDRPEILKRLSKKKRRVLARTGGYTRKIVKTTLNKRWKKGDAVKKDEPPRRRTGLLRELVYFGVRRDSDTVDIAPKLIGGSVVPEILEFGGTERISVIDREQSTRKPERQIVRKTVTVDVDPHPYLGPSYPEAVDALRKNMSETPL